MWYWTKKKKEQFTDMEITVQNGKRFNFEMVGKIQLFGRHDNRQILRKRQKLCFHGECFKENETEHL